MGFIGFKELAISELGTLVSPSFMQVSWPLNETLISSHQLFAKATKVVPGKGRVVVKGFSALTGAGEGSLCCDYCGFYSYKRPEFVHIAEAYRHHKVYAVVDNFGKVIEHEFGYRAEKSKLLAYCYIENRNQTLEWCSDNLEDHISPDFIEWANDKDSQDEWVMLSGDEHLIARHYLNFWLDNPEKRCNLRVIGYKYTGARNIEPGWGERYGLNRGH